MSKSEIPKNHQYTENARGTVSWRSPSNIALIKYWGKKGFQIPSNPSLSMTLSDSFTETLVKYSLTQNPGTISFDFYFEGARKPQFGQKIATFLETVSDIFPFHYLIRVNQFDDVAKNTIDEWIYFFKNSEIPDNFNAKGLAEAREKLKTIKMSPKQLADYSRYLERLSSDASIAQTMNFETEFKAKVKIATNLLKNKVSKEVVKISTELPQSVIDDIENKLNE